MEAVDVCVTCQSLPSWPLSLASSSLTRASRQDPTSSWLESALTWQGKGASVPRPEIARTQEMSYIASSVSALSSSTAYFRNSLLTGFFKETWTLHRSLLCSLLIYEIWINPASPPPMSRPWAARSCSWPSAVARLPRTCNSAGDKPPGQGGDDYEPGSVIHGKQEGASQAFSHLAGPIKAWKRL